MSFRVDLVSLMVANLGISPASFFRLSTQEIGRGNVMLCWLLLISISFVISSGSINLLFLGVLPNSVEEDKSLTESGRVMVIFGTLLFADTLMDSSDTLLVTSLFSAFDETVAVESTEVVEFVVAVGFVMVIAAAKGFSSFSVRRWNSSTKESTRDLVIEDSVAISSETPTFFVATFPFASMPRNEP